MITGHNVLRTSDNVDKIFAALSEAQKEFPAVNREKVVRQKGVSKAGKDYEINYSYAPLEKIIESLRPIMVKNGLGFFQSQPGNFVITRVIHSSGQWYETDFPVLGQGQLSMQDFGKISTYGRRYGFLQSVGAQPDDEDDDTSTVQNKAQQKPPQRPNTGAAPSGGKAQGSQSPANPGANKPIINHATGKPVEVPKPRNLDNTEQRIIIEIAKAHKYQEPSFYDVVRHVTGKENLTEVPAAKYAELKKYFETTPPPANQPLPPEGL